MVIFLNDTDNYSLFCLERKQFIYLIFSIT